MGGKVPDDEAVAVLRRPRRAGAETSKRSGSGADPLRVELDDLLRAAGVEEPDRPPVARLLGWDGRGGASARSVCHELGTGLDELRRAEERLREYVSGGVAATPVLDAALDVLEETWPATSTTAALALRSRGLSSERFDPRGVLRAAKLLRRRTDLIVEQGSPSILTKRGFEQVAAGVGVACALALAGRAVATVDDVLAHLTGDQDPSRWRVLVAELVDIDDQLEWLDVRRRSFGRAGVTRHVLDALARAVERDGECSVADALALLTEDPAIGPGIGKRLLSAICGRAEDLEIDGDVLRRRAAPPDCETTTDQRGSDEIDVADVEAAARRAALVEVLRMRPETSLAELCAAKGDAGEWLRASTIIDLAMAALEAGVGRSAPRSVSERKRPRAKLEPHAPADQLSFALEAPASAEAMSEPQPAGDYTAVEVDDAPATTASPRSSGATPSLDLAAPVRSGRASTSSQATEEERVRSATPVDGSDIVAALRDAPAPGLTISELEDAVGGLRSRVRRILRELEAKGVVRREGAVRWTRYRLADARADDPSTSDDDPAVHVTPIRRRRSDVEGVRVLYYRSHATAEPQKVAEIVLRGQTITIAYAEDQRPFDKLERITTADGVVTPDDGLRYWTALESAFSTSAHFFVSTETNPRPGRAEREP